MASNKVSVLVAGSWGTALASVLADRGKDVWIWTRNADQADELNRNHTNRRFLPDIILSPNIHATTSIDEALHDAEAVIIAAPSSGMREVARLMKPFVRPDMLIIHATKGFETDTMNRMSTVIADELPQTDRQRIVVLSGPSHAEEVIRKCPTTVVVASEQITAAEAAQDLLITPYFRVYTNSDVIGVEVGGALKNIIALGAGMTNGLGFGDNAKAALLTRGLAEIARLGVAMGANPLTFAGLAGVGDLVVTCTSQLSRNWRAGYLLGKGQSLEAVLKEVGMVVEGVRTTQTAYELSRKYKVNMPITDELYAVLFKGKTPRTAVEDLMARGKTSELEEMAPALEKWID